MGSSSVVIKVKFEDSFRRFNARIHKDEFCFNVAMLKEKIRGLFDLEPDIDFTLTYIDEDGDAVTIADEYDLCEAARQSLDPMRLTVRLKNNGSFVSRKESSIAIKDQCHFRALFSVVAEFLKAVPESHHEVFWTLLFHWTAKPESRMSELAELMELLRIIQLEKLYETGPDPGSCTPMGAPDVNDQEGLKVKEQLEKLYETGPDLSSCTTMGAPDVNDQEGSKVKEPKGLMDGEVGSSNSKEDEGLKHGNVHPSSSGDPKFLDYLRDSCLKDKDLFAAFEKKKYSESGFGIQSKSFGFGASNPDYLKHCLQESNFRCMKTNDSDFGWPFMSSCVSSISPFKSIYSHDNDSGSEFHMGVNCAGCGVNPIYGPRFASKTKPGYNLCSTCFEAMGYEHYYTRIYHSLVSSNLSNLNGFSDHHSQFKLDSSCVLDVEILDGAIVAPCTEFTKTWWMRNTGDVVWPRGSRLVWVGGSKLVDMDSVPIEITSDGFPVGHEYDITVDFIAPERPDRYVSYWRMASPSGEQFGVYLSVIIEVNASMKDSGETSIDLNLPPTSNGSKDPEVVNPENDHESVFHENHFPEAMDSQNMSSDTQPQKDQEMIGNKNLSNTTTAAAVAASSTVVLPPSNTHNESPLLKELAEMGFKNNNLNRELLKKYEYDLTKSLRDRWEDIEWDPILDELQQLFPYKEMNKRFLKKNNGSIRHVLADLINGGA